jgi:long-chain acyl-CoA synthetase
MTLDQIVRRNAMRFANKPALISETAVRTWAEFDQRVDRLANALSALGLTRGERVAILLGNCIEYPEIYFACARAGAIAVPLNYRLTVAEMTQILQHAEPRLMVVGASDAQKADALQASIGSMRDCWVVGGTSAAEYEARLAAASPAPPAAAAVESDTFAIFFTSGTTGLPKGAMVSHLNLEANAFNQFVADGSRADDVNLVATPLYHMGAVFMAITYMMLGCTQVILPQFSPSEWLRTLERRRATVSLLIPTMINAVLNERSFADYDRSSLRLIFYGGGPMPPAVLEHALKLFRCGFTQGYGLTETLEATFLVAADHVLDCTEAQRHRLSSAGREAVGADVRIVDEGGQDVAPRTIGEILVRSRSVIAGYWRQPELSAKTIRDDWFYTGDLGYLDEDRYLFVVDRKTDMVVTGGVNVYTREVETVLYQHDGVREAAVFGIPDDHWGEMLVAAVAVRDGCVLSETALIDFCRDKLAGFKRPKRVILLPELPKNASGKILKRELKTLASRP